jgi:hypothetical protein
LIQSTRLAKIAYWLSGQLTRIKTNQMTYEWVNPQEWMDSIAGEELPELDMRPAGKSKLPCRLSMKMLQWSDDLDYKHWDHWALDHTNCNEGYTCTQCGGHIDPPQEEDW